MKLEEKSKSSLMKELERKYSTGERFSDRKYKNIIVRLDGKNFSKLTKNLEKPFDKDFLYLMRDLTKEIAFIFGATIAFTQSDEITLVFSRGKKLSSTFIFDGKRQKIESVLAAYAAGYFNKYISSVEKLKNRTDIIMFDARCYPTTEINETIDSVEWRVEDAVKNSRNLYASSLCSHKEIQGMGRVELEEKMLKEKGFNFSTDRFFEGDGFLFIKEEREKQVTREELEEKNVPEEVINKISGKFFKRKELIQYLINKDSLELMRNKIKEEEV